MESIKFINKYVDTSGIYDSSLQKTQIELNAKMVTADLTSASIGVPNPVNADTLGGIYTASNITSALDTKLDTANVVNNFTTTEPGYALDARAGKSLNDSLNTYSMTNLATNAQLFKCGHIGMLYLNGATVSDIKGVTFPDGYKPKYQTTFDILYRDASFKYYYGVIPLLENSGIGVSLSYTTAMGQPRVDVPSTMQAFGTITYII